MSSEGSVSVSSSSRIRQFGLYRTIDARTEEFLRLSRKRQLKQGCACAAISTAITVTVVITVFFVYMEYGMNTDANQQSIGKAAWIGLLNDSLASSFEEKFSKSKINFDLNTIKLLPILIKALKQNRYLEKILEDYSSSSPTYDGKITTEFSFKKDIFLNTKNWIKKPSLRQYTIEYKTSPIVLHKSHTREPGYFTKNRKIREYKRIMAYVEKMINDKVGFSSTVPMNDKKFKTQTEKITEPLPQMASKPLSPVKINKNYKSPKNKLKVMKQKPDEVISCKCPKQLSTILNKIFSSIQQLLPDDEISKTRPCSSDQKSDTIKPNSETPTYQPKINLTTMTLRGLVKSNAKSLTVTKPQSKNLLQLSEFDNIYRKGETPNLSEETVTPSYSKYMNSLKQHNMNSLDSTNESSTDDTLNSKEISTVDSPVQQKNTNAMNANDVKTSPSFWSSRLFSPDFGELTTKAYDHIEPTEAHYNITATTQPMPSTIDIMEKEIERDQIDNPGLTTGNKLTLESDEFNTFQSYYTNKHSDRDFNHMSRNPNNMSVVSSVIDQEYNTSKSGANHSSNKTSIVDTTIFLSTIESSTADSAMTSPYRKADSGVKQITFTTHFYGNPSKTTTDNEKSENKKFPKINANKVASSTRINKTATKNIAENNIYDQIYNKSEPLYLGLDNIALEDEIEKMTRNDEEQLNVRRIETGPDNLKNHTNTSKEFWQNFYSNERVYRPNSMILNYRRPTYLEIHRNNDWKPEENKDYDTDMKYNIFDLL